MRGLVLVGLVVALAAGCDDGSSPADAAPLTADAGVQGATGFVTLTSGTYDFGGEEESAMWSMAAGFSRAGESERSCVTEVRGDCRLSDCVAVGLPDAGAVDGGPVGAPHAGTIAASAGILQGAVVPDVTGTYSSDGDSTVFWSGGQAVSIEAPGAEVPAFTGSLVGPTNVQVANPVFGSETIMGVSRATDIAVNWTGGEQGQVVARATRVDVNRTWQVECFAAADTGSLTVPASALSILPPGEGNLAITVEEIQGVVAGDYDIRLSAVSTARTAAGWASTIADFK